MSTLGDIKYDVSSQLGAIDGNISVPKRDRAINRARRKFYGERKWSFCNIPDASVTITTQQGDLPTDYNRKFDPNKVYVYSGGVEYVFAKKQWSEIDAYPADSYVYAINKNTNKIKLNQTQFASILLDYQALPANAPLDTTQDATVELAPDIEPINNASIAYWWLTSERNTANFDRFMDLYKEGLGLAVQADTANQPVRTLRSLPIKQGYNKSYGNYAPRGYVGRR